MIVFISTLRQYTYTYMYYGQIDLLLQIGRHAQKRKMLTSEMNIISHTCMCRNVYKLVKSIFLFTRNNLQ